MRQHTRVFSWRRTMLSDGADMTRAGRQCIPRSVCVFVQLFVVENCVDDWRIALSWRVTLQITAELVVCSVHPAPGVSQFTSWDALNDDRSTRPVARVPVDVLLSLPMFLRLYLVSRGSLYMLLCSIIWKNKFNNHPIVTVMSLRYLLSRAER